MTIIISISYNRCFGGVCFGGGGVSQNTFATDICSNVKHKTKVLEILSHMIYTHVEDLVNKS